MIVDNASGVQAPSGRKPDAKSYSYAGDGSNFMSILTQLSPPREKDAPQDLSNDTAKNPVAPSSVEGDTPAEEEHDSPQVGNGESDDVASETVEGPANGPTPPHSPSRQDSEVAMTTALPPGATGTETAVEEGVTVKLPTAPPISGTEEALAAEAEPIPPAEDTNTTEDANSTDETLLDVSTLDEATVDEAAPHQRNFPKTLNAFLAEKSVTAPESEVPEETMVKDLKTTALEESLQPNPDSDTNQEVAPLPQSTAMETGGVRSTAQSALPRIPLSNLPGEIAQQVHLIQKEGTSTLRMRLMPENLGELQLEVHRSGDVVRVTMVSANPQVRDALESQMSQLRDALEKQGFTLGEASVGDHAQSQDDPAPGERPSAYNSPPVHGTAPALANSRSGTVISPLSTLSATSGLNVLA